LRQGTRGVLRIGVGNGDGDARLHGQDDNAPRPRRAKGRRRQALRRRIKKLLIAVPPLGRDTASELER
jgi:hypothetical protein